MKERRAFTLIEMLVVIAIIGIVAALVVNMNALVKARERATMVQASMRTIMLAIDDYQSKMNFYPPDNGNLVNLPVGPIYDAYAATNPLIYELTGATNNPPGYPGQIQVFNSTTPISAKGYYEYFDRMAVNNGNPDEPHDFFQSGPQLKDYTNYNNSLLQGLLVPVPLTDVPGVKNFWHYDSSTTNRHNLASYDLWAEYTVPGKNNVLTTNGNW